MLIPPTAAYIHIPFCRRRCYYCDFPISVIGDRQRGETSGTIAYYVDLLCQEILATPKLGAPLSTLFFGGGTPSLLSVSQLEHIIQTLAHQFGLEAIAEISMEIDPGTFDREHLQGYQTAGVNRLSLGVQAFQADILAACGRTHTPADIDRAVEDIRQVGITNVSLDLISGLPHLTLDQWHTSLQAAIALAPTHLSIYDLTVEPKTAFSRWYQPGDAPLPSEETTVEMYRMAHSQLTAAGYEHYEISNYARPGYACRHNRVYWENRPYYGFGMGAASYTNGQRFTRPRTRQEYGTWLQTFIAQNGAIAEPPTPVQEQLLDTLMLGLRLAEGINLRNLAQRFGEATIQQILSCLEPYMRQGWVILEEQQVEELQGDRPGNSAAASLRLCLHQPEGYLFSNTILATLFEKLGDT